MAWTAVIQNRNDQGDSIQVYVAATDGVSQKFEKWYTTDGSMASLRPQVLRTITENGKVQAKDEVSVGATIDTSPVVPPVPPVQTPDELARAKFFTDYRLLQSGQRATSVGLTADVSAVDLVATQKYIDDHPDVVAFL